MNGRPMGGLYAEAQERQARLTQRFFAASQELVDRARRGQAAGRNFAREESAEHSVDFLESLFFYYRESIRATELESIKNTSNNRPWMSGEGSGAMRRSWRHRWRWWIRRHLRFPTAGARTVVEDLPKRRPCQVGSKTDRPCPRPAVVEVWGLPFCERCVRGQEAYFAIGELTQGEEETRGLRDEPLVEALGRMRRERTSYATVAEMEKVTIGDPQ